MDQRPPDQPPAEKGGRHRGLGYRPIEPPDRDIRSFLFVFLWGLIGMGWGTETALSGDLGPLTRLVGAASAAAGALLWLSYILYLNPCMLGPTWQQVPSRRRAAFVLRYLWFVPAILLGALQLAHWIAAR